LGILKGDVSDLTEIFERKGENVIGRQIAGKGGLVLRGGEWGSPSREDTQGPTKTEKRKKKRQERDRES